MYNKKKNTEPCQKDLDKFPNNKLYWEKKDTRKKFCYLGKRKKRNISLMEKTGDQDYDDFPLFFKLLNAFYGSKINFFCKQKRLFRS